jgi:hypothetical protein
MRLSSSPSVPTGTLMPERATEMLTLLRMAALSSLSPARVRACMEGRHACAGVWKTKWGFGQATYNTRSWDRVDEHEAELTHGGLKQARGGVGEHNL